MIYSTFKNNLTYPYLVDTLALINCCMCVLLLNGVNDLFLGINFESCHALIFWDEGSALVSHLAVSKHYVVKVKHAVTL